MQPRRPRPYFRVYFLGGKQSGSFFFCDSCEAGCRKQENKMFEEQKKNEPLCFPLKKYNHRNKGLRNVFVAQILDGLKKLNNEQVMTSA